MEELDLKELISIFLEKKILIILVVIIFAMLGAIYTLKFIVPEYQSETSLVLVQVERENAAEGSAISTTDITINSKLVDDYRILAKSKNIVEEVKNNLNLKQEIESIQNSITVSAVSDTRVIKISVVHTDPEIACKIANETADVFVEKVSDMYKTSNLYVWERAEVPSDPSNINLFKNVVIFSFFGGVLVIIYILLINMLDTTVKTDLDIEKALQLPVLASIMLTDENTKKKHKAKKHRNYKKNDGKSSTEVKIPYAYNELIKKETSGVTSSFNIPKRTIRRKDGKK